MRKIFVCLFVAFFIFVTFVLSSVHLYLQTKETDVEIHICTNNELERAHTHIHMCTHTHTHAHTHAHVHAHTCHGGRERRVNQSPMTRMAAGYCCIIEMPGLCDLSHRPNNSRSLTQSPHNVIHAHRRADKGREDCRHPTVAADVARTVFLPILFNQHHPAAFFFFKCSLTLN